MKDFYDVVIVGGGHNGLVAAGYLAGAGLSTLVLAHRRSLKKIFTRDVETVDWRMVMSLRLAALIYRSRADIPLPEIVARVSGNSLRLGIALDWLAANPLTVTALHVSVPLQSSPSSQLGSPAPQAWAQIAQASSPASLPPSFVEASTALASRPPSAPASMSGEEEQLHPATRAKSTKHARIGPS